MFSQGELSQYQLQHERNESDKAKANEFLSSEKKKLSQLNEKLEELEKVVQEKVNEASKLCPRIVSPGYIYFITFHDIFMCFLYIFL